MSISAYLNFQGTCEEAFLFYSSLMDGKLGEIRRYKGSPAEEMAPDGNADLVMHLRLTIGNTILMGSDVSASRYDKPAGIHLSYQCDDIEKARSVFEGLSTGGHIIMPFEPSFWAQGFGMVTDKYNIPWMVNCE